MIFMKDRREASRVFLKPAQGNTSNNYHLNMLCVVMILLQYQTIKNRFLLILRYRIPAAAPILPRTVC